MHEKKIKPVLIVGGGISGITTSLEIAETGHEVILVEKLPYLGGKVVKMNQYFPKLCPPVCGLEIDFRRIKNSKRIHVYTSSELISISGKKGSFKVKIQSSPEYVNSNCTSCGKCVDVCPENRLNEFNFDMDTTKAIYLPHEMAFPWKYTIDSNYCKGEACNKCVEVCEYNAVHLSARAEVNEFNVHSVVFATGWELYDAGLIEKFHFSDHPDILTNIMMERLGAPNGPTKGEILKLSDGKPPKSICFVQCAGSRDQNHLPYCSAVCCSASLKQALYAAESLPDCQISIFYIDMRVTGRNEDFLNKVKEYKNIRLIKGKVGKTEVLNGQLTIHAEDILSGKKITQEVGLVVLATGIQPSKIGGKTLIKDDNGFLNSETHGIYTTACASKPIDVASSIKESTGTALKAIQL